MKFYLRVIFMAGLLLSVSSSMHAKPLELPQIQVVPIQDSATQRHYELYIKLPDDYKDKSDKKHPVIYYTDAMWHVELLSSATAFLMEDAILVGISWQKDSKDLNTELRAERGEYVSRFRDYSFRPSDNPERQARGRFGQADQHLTFIRNEVIKYIEKTYRAEPSNRTYFGYSLGGEFGAYSLLMQPDTFKNYILGSPSFGSADVSYLAQLAAKVQPEPLNANVFISYGSLEKEPGKHIDELITLLNNRKDKGLVVTHKIIEGDHSTAFPLTGVQSVTWLAGLQKKDDKG